MVNRLRCLQTITLLFIDLKSNVVSINAKIYLQTLTLLIMGPFNPILANYPPVQPFSKLSMT